MKQLVPILLMQGPSAEMIKSNYPYGDHPYYEAGYFFGSKSGSAGYLLLDCLQLPAAVLSASSVQENRFYHIQCGSYTFTGSGREVIEEGFRKVYQPMLNNHVQNLDEDESNVLPPLMKGDVLGVPNCAISDKKTMPPKRFTEGTLISAMANIWKYVAPDNPNRMKLKDIKGIGTPATRARIIDELLAIRLSGHPVRPFLSKKGKDLIPTDFGFFTIDHIHESLTKPDLTADIEFQLSEIVKNASLSDATMERMIEMMKDNIAFADSSTFPPPKDAVPCPVCHKSYLARHTMKDGKGAYYRCCDLNCVSPTALFYVHKITFTHFGFKAHR